jgi:capsular polysaccharide biosynthesis protein
LKQDGNDRIEEDEIDLMELFFELLNNWKVILISTVLVGVIAFVYSKFLITPQYESTSQLYVLSKSTSITSLADVQLGANLTNDYIVVVKTYN